MGKFKDYIGLNDLTANKVTLLWRALLAEFIGNLLLNFFGCASTLNLAPTSAVVATTDNNTTITVGVNDINATLVLISLTFGFIIFVVVLGLGHVSGAHINPAVTSGMLVTGNSTVIKAVLYIVAQCIGSICGSAILKALTPESVHAGGLGMTKVSPLLSSIQGFGIEFFLGFILVMTVFGACDENRPESKASAALAIGLAVAIGHLSCIDFTGASMNPARTFGSAVISGIWENHWVYWLGPCLGGIGAALLYKNAFAAPPLGPVKIIERYTTTMGDEKELKRLDGEKHDTV